MRIYLGCLALAFGMVACAGDEAASDSVNRFSTLVETTSGSLEGQGADEAGGVLAFRGIPFAQPPIGDLRWRPPQPPKAWEGTRSAAQAGLPCWQPISPPTSIYSRGEMELGEDCLYLNLWTPATSSDERLPVMVWFHGGGHNTGHGSSLVFDGTSLARKGVVLISANYRLGAIGFMAHPALTAESEHTSSGNYGILDKIATLEWVRDNAAAFGGDPLKVTIFGQSAGSTSVCTLMASPLAAGLFHRVIGHSASCIGERMELEAAQERGSSLAAALGIEGEGAEAATALREVEPAKVLEASRTPGSASPGIQVDGWVVPKQMRGIFEAREHNDVPVIVGWTSDEGKGLFAGLPEMTQEDCEAWIRQRFGDRADDVLALYADEAEAESPKVARQSIQADQAFGWGAREWVRLVEAAGNDAYHYFFSQAAPVYNLYLPDRPQLEVPEGPRGYGAYHSGDLAYAFGNQHLVGFNWTEQDREVSRVMSQYWVNFARTGDPNGEGVPHWPRYEAATDQSIELGAEIGVVSEVRKEKLDLFGSLR